MKKTFLIFLVISFLSCSKDNAETSVQFTPVDSMHLLFGKWNVEKIENFDGDMLYEGCDLSELHIDFKGHGDTATWKRLGFSSIDECRLNTYEYFDWSVKANNLGYVELYVQGSGGYSYRVCKADLNGENKLRLAIVTIRKGGTGELIKSIPRDEREYYFFNKDNN